MFVSSLLFVTVAYTQVLHKIITKQNHSFVLTDSNGDAEEPIEKTSSEENAREIDQDEDSFNLNETIIPYNENSLSNSKNENYSFGLSGFYPEIVSPPPQD
jgi:hypothetical protein